MSWSDKILSVGAVVRCVLRWISFLQNIYSRWWNAKIIFQYSLPMLRLSPYEGLHKYKNWSVMYAHMLQTKNNYFRLIPSVWMPQLTWTTYLCIYRNTPLNLPHLLFSLLLSSIHFSMLFDTFSPKRSTCVEPVKRSQNKSRWIRNPATGIPLL